MKSLTSRVFIATVIWTILCLCSHVPRPYAGQVVDESSSVEADNGDSTPQSTAADVHLNPGSADENDQVQQSTDTGSGNGYGGSSQTAPTSREESRQSLKESKKDLLNSMIRYAIQSVERGLSQSLNNSNARKGGQNLKQPESNEPSQSQGRRPKPSRWDSVP